MSLHLLPPPDSPDPTPSARLRGLPSALVEPSTFEACVAQALTALDARGPSAASDLFDLVSRPVYSLLLAITGDETAAQEATVEAFAEMWVSCGSRPAGAGTAWVMDVACSSARARVRAANQPVARLRLVPTG